MFNHKPIHKVTWIHPRSGQGHMLDYVICRDRDFSDVCNVRVMRGAECGTDHFLVRAKIKLKILRRRRPNGVKIPKRIDISKVNDPTKRNELSHAFLRENFDGSWENFKTKLYDVTANVLGHKKIEIGLMKMIWRFKVYL